MDTNLNRNNQQEQQKTDKQRRQIYYKGNEASQNQEELLIRAEPEDQKGTHKSFSQDAAIVAMRSLMERTGVCLSAKIKSWLQRSHWRNHVLTARQREEGKHGPQLPRRGEAPPPPRPHSMEISPSPGGLGRS